jgi:hypothetical protein
MGRLFLVALIALGGPALVFAQRGAGRGAGGVAPAASHAAMGGVHAPIASAHPGARSVAGAPVVARSSGFVSHSPRTHRIRPINAQNDFAPLSPLGATDFEGVPGLGFDFPHLAAISGGRHQGGRFGGFPFGFNGGFLFGSPSVIVEEMGPAEAQAAPVQEDNAVGNDPETDYVRRARSVSPRDYVAQNPGSGATSTPDEDPAEYVFVRRDGGLIFAVAYSWVNGTLRYVTRDGMRRTIARDAVDLTATEQFNEQRGLNFRSPAA